MKILAPVFVLFIFLSCFFALTEGDFFHDFLNPRLRHTPQFTGSQLYAVEVGFKGLSGTIGCFGDFNSDKFTDVFVITDNRTSVDVYLWDTDDWVFRISSASIVSPNITNLVASDFNHDGKLDLMVMGFNEQDINGTSLPTTYVKLYIGDLNTLALEPIDIPDAVDQLLVFDANNDLYPDLFGELPGEPPRRAFWINNYNGGRGFTTQLQTNNGAPLYPLAHPHSNGFADFNGDCLADLFVTSIKQGAKQYEIWINTKSSFVQRNVVTLPTGSGQVTFADFDGDGTLDMCVPVCDPPSTCETENSVRIIYNKQKPLCSFFGSKANCRTTTALCSADDGFILSNVTQPFGDVGITSVDGIPTSAFAGNRFSFDDWRGRPLTVRIGDYNLDGYADLIVPVRDAVTNISRVEIWTNIGLGGGRRGFQRQTEGVADLMSIPNVYAASFFDLDENGNLDLLVLADNQISAVYNNFQNDAFFLKAVGLNGVCTTWCSGIQFPNPKPYGVNFPGGTFKFTITDLSGGTHLAIGTQMAQSSYLALNTPYVMFGLGRTSNYIEEFFYGVPLNQDVHFNFWTGSTIPNSQVVAIPYKPADPTSWTLELYTNPSGVMFWVIIAVVVSLIIIGGIVFFFYRKEKKEDEKQKQDAAHLFSFDAL